jgi:hypothetical protein
MDEGGISQHEPIAIVAGVYVHGDDQIIPLEDELDALIRRHIPEQDWPGFVLHAKDIWHGAKYFRDRNTWPWERRAAILDDLVQIPGKLETPIVFSRLVKATAAERHNPRGEMSAHAFDVSCHAIAFSGCVLRVEEFMRHIWPTEIAQIVAEDNPSARQTIKGVTDLFRNPDRLNRGDLQSVDILPLERIRGSIQFADKNEYRPLQLADACAFLIRRRFVRHDDRSERFYRVLKRWMLVLHAEDEPDNWSALTPSIAPEQSS